MFIALSLFSAIGVSSVSTGLCEGDYSPRCKVVGISEAKSRVARACTWKACEVTDDPVPERETSFTYTIITDFTNEVVATFVEGGAEQRKAYTRVARAEDVQDVKKLAPYLTENGFTKDLSPKYGACTLVIEGNTKSVDEDAQDATYDVELRVMRDGRAVFTKTLGQACFRGKATHDGAAFALPSSKGAVVFTALTECVGPPPGYFGEDDPGSDEVSRSETVSWIPLATPELLACLGAEGGAPK